MLNVGLLCDVGLSSSAGEKKKKVKKCLNKHSFSLWINSTPPV